VAHDQADGVLGFNPAQPPDIGDLMSSFLNEVLTPEQWPTFVFITARLIGLGMTAPLWLMPTFPHSARAAIIAVLAIVLLPGAPKTAIPEQALEVPLPLAMELVIGISIGLTAAVIIQGAAYAGDVLSLQTGLSLGAALSGGDVPGAGLGQLKSLTALLIYVTMGGHLTLLRGLSDSLQVVPPGLPLNVVDGGLSAAATVGMVFTSAVRVAAPAMVALLLTNLALAILSRAVPQLNVIMVSFPITIGLGLVMIGASLPIFGAAISGWVSNLPAAVSAVISGFALMPGIS
jgi:flagellar biosynthetic protein FliR